ncbi:hypothetical protein [Actinomyces faecalis]|uniref:hypothetical protein n=1 Tax=Actinomyces faecalis TaxID=2722820 RepID=UPI0015542A90|nr:hypothetical protein [Actinomyces faecalis]
MPPPPLPDDTASRELRWASPSGGQVRALVFGGAFTVDLDELDVLAEGLTRGADLLREALAHLGTALAQVEATGHPLSFSTVPWEPVDPFVAEQRRAQAVQAIESLQSGPGSLREAADLVQALSEDVTTSAQTYADAEAGSTRDWTSSIHVLGQVSLLHALGRGSGLAAALLRLLETSPSLSGSARATVGRGIQDLIDQLPEGAVKDGLADLLIVMSDAELAHWVRTDLLAVLVLGGQAVRAATSQEAARLETYLSQAARRLDPVITPRLPRSLPVGSRTVPTASLTPMQRVTAYLAILSSQAGAERYGSRRALRLTPHGADPFTVPTALADPLGLATAISPLAVSWPHAGPGLAGRETAADRASAGAAASDAVVPGRCLAPLATPSDVMRYSDGLKQMDSDETTGVISLVRTDHADGTRSWLVVVPGTTSWGMGGPNPQDMLTNLEAVAGMPTDMESVVVSAMRAAGVGPQEPVALYGHSQGAITATNIAADPAVAERFTVTTLLTVGGPVAGAVVPETVSTLHVENGADAVPALDARANPVGPTRLTVRIDTTDSGLEGYPHGSLVYADALEGMPSAPATDRWVAQLRGITGAGEEGAVTSELVFDVERLPDPEAPGRPEG